MIESGALKSRNYKNPKSRNSPKICRILAKSQGVKIRISGFQYYTNPEIIEKFRELLFTKYGNPEIKKLFVEGFSTSILHHFLLNLHPERERERVLCLTPCIDKIGLRRKLTHFFLFLCPYEHLD